MGLARWFSAQHAPASLAARFSIHSPVNLFPTDGPTRASFVGAPNLCLASARASCIVHHMILFSSLATTTITGALACLYSTGVPLFLCVKYSTGVPFIQKKKRRCFEQQRQLIHRSIVKFYMSPCEKKKR